MEQSSPAVAANSSVQRTETDMNRLSFEEKRLYLNSLPPAERIPLLLGDREAPKLTRSLLPQELYWLFKEVDTARMAKLLALASPRQCIFVLDMELWRKWSFEEDRAVEYLGYILQGADEHFIELLPHLDFNLLALFLGRELIVAGGIGDLNTDEERQADWDHTFDGVFMIKYRNRKHARIIGSFLELVCRYDNPLYVALMESVSGEVDLELEEECYHLKSGRLADLGFPPHDEALEIYYRIKPEQFVPGRYKLQEQPDEATSLPRPVVAGNSFLEQLLALVDSNLLRMELHYLINTALVADQAHFAGTEYMRAVVERVYNYLNIALEFLCNGDLAKGAEIMGGEYLKRLFQLGFSIVLELKLRADSLADGNYATGKALAGLRIARPLYYRGLDQDGVDGYREFRELADVQRVSDFLADMEE